LRHIRRSIGYSLAVNPMIGPIHIKAKKGEVAERVIVAGDPARVEQVASILENARLVNKNRGLLVYTGKYQGIDISVAMHGIGGPSSAIVFEELRMLGAKVIVRLGTCGAMFKGAKIGDVVIPTGASYYPGGLFRQYLGSDVCLCAVPDLEVITKIVESCRKHGLRHFAGPVISSDAFYAEDPNFASYWSSKGVLAVEMECATLFMLGLMRKFRAGALLLVSDSLVEDLGFASAEELKPYVEKAVYALLDALVSIEV